ncbi:Uncharacterized protein Rs2_45950 [Raphanus sativus]|nr:Uncharacterized protein Rs2_45950 [Raphanus sativus]
MQQNERERDGIKRIKAPRLDNATLIKENALTLIGRLTNPQEQQMSDLIPALPRKWNLRGRTEGADLGQDLGTFENHELTKTTARVRVHIDGFKPLVKEAIVEFDSGEEVFITLEYEKLEMHCSTCGSLFHHRSTCPPKLNVPEERLTNNKHTSEEETSRTVTQNHTKANNNLTSDSRYHRTGTKAMERQTYAQKEHQSHTNKEFQERLDRHGRPFGERVSTKHTRNPPPTLTLEDGEINRISEIRPLSTAKELSYASPTYSRRREGPKTYASRPRDLFPRRSEGQWRPKLVVVPNPPEEMQNRNQLILAEGTSNTPPLQIQETEEHLLAKEAIMEELHDVTRKYLSCKDPAEAAARRQRVLQSDAEGLMEATAASILAASTVQQNERNLRTGELSNPAIPPPLQDPLLQALIYPAPLALFEPINGGEENIGQDPYYSDVSPLTHQEPRQPAWRTPRLRSTVVSSQEITRDTPLALQTPLELRNDNETLRSFQDRAKGKEIHSKRKSPARNTPNILRGASSKKRNISQIRNSPRRQTTGETNGDKKKKQKVTRQRIL